MRCEGERPRSATLRPLGLLSSWQRPRSPVRMPWWRTLRTMRGDAQPSPVQGAHPLAVRIAELLPVGSRVLVLGAGNGRNLPPLATAGLETDVRAAADGLGGMRGSYAGIL